MVADGKHELAAELLRWAQPRFPHSRALSAARMLAYSKLMEKYQEFNPFKFILYGGQIDEPTVQVEAHVAGASVWSRESAASAAGAVLLDGAHQGVAQQQR
jgi:hypothetical protein